MYRLLLPFALALAAGCSYAPPEPFGPVPTPQQLAWQRMEINMFCHFGPNTFSGAEWGNGQEPEDLFNPRSLDCGQWVDVAEQAGMQGIILTAKHHDGFCLWPSAFSTHTVAQSTWNEGRGDVVRQFVDACRGRVKAGVYISPWDRNHPTYGAEEYNAVFSNTLKEVHENYGPLFEQWFDGACGEGPNGKKQEYDWPLFEGSVLGINPQCILFSDVGPGCRWVGNEEGRCGETCWSTLHVENGERKLPTVASECGTPPSTSNLQHSTLDWVPAEVDVSIRPGWFWHADEHPKTVDELMDIYFNSVGRNGLLLLNVPPDTNGRICAEDSLRLVEFRRERDRIFSHDLTAGAEVHAWHKPGYQAKNVLDTAYHTYWAATGKNADLTMELDTVSEFDIIVIQEYIPLGQRITSVNLLLDPGDGLYSYTLGDHPLCTTVGYKRIIRLDRPVRWQKLVFQFEGMAPPVINRIALYNSKAQ